MVPIDRALSLGAVILFAAAISTAASTAAKAGPRVVAGVPEVITGDTLKVQGLRIRLSGIDAPEPDQVCLLPHKAYDCGYIAATALMDLTAGTQVDCILGPPAEDGAVVAVCRADGYDLSEGMTYTGWALALPGVESRYHNIEARAKEAGRGLWRGEFVMPWDWRRGERLPAAE
ncbi:MAG: thermonuclease family protein [Kiloniellaceae bacterium]